MDHHGDMMLRKRFEWIYRHVHYEDRAWPLWQWHKNIMYLLKGRFLCRKSEHYEDEVHFKAAAAYVDRWVSTPKNNNEELSGDPATIALVADIMWVPRFKPDYLSVEIGAFFSGVDLTLLNLETPISIKHAIPKNTFDCFNSPAGVLIPWVRLPGRKVFSVCNNHALDCGREGLHLTTKAVHAQPDSQALGGDSAGDETLICDIQGIRVGILGATYGINKYRGREPAVGIPIINFTSPDDEVDWGKLEKHIALLRDRDCELIILAAHWGYEYEYWPTERQRNNAYRLIESGVDIIAGTSPHVVQPIEFVSIDGFDMSCPVQIRRGGEKKQGVIFYSLGNALSCLRSPGCKEGIVAKLELCKLNNSRSISFRSLGVLPTTTAVHRKNYYVKPIPSTATRFWFRYVRSVLAK